MFNMVCFLELFVSQEDLRSELRYSFPHNFCSTDYAKAFNCVDHNKLWKILKETGIPDYLTCLLRDLYAGQEATELDMEQQTGSKLGRYMTRLYAATLLIYLTCRLHHAKCPAR